MSVEFPGYPRISLIRETGSKREAFIRPGDFKCLQETLTDSNGERYKNGRNLASGSVRLLDGAACRERKVMFMPFAVVEGFPELGLKSQKLRRLPELGFQVCKFITSRRSLTCQEMEEGIGKLEQFAGNHDIPIDGIVASYNDIAFPGPAEEQATTTRTAWPLSLRTSSMRQSCFPSNGTLPARGNLPGGGFSAGGNRRMRSIQGKPA